jgi:hypothetical protein
MMASVVNTDASAQQRVQPCNTSVQCKKKKVGKHAIAKIVQVKQTIAGISVVREKYM